jgi:lipoate-protein ligase B
MIPGERAMLDKAAPSRSDGSPRCGDCRLLEYSRLDYARARKLQLEILGEKASGKIEQDVLVLLEHPPVFTLGRSAERGNLLISEDRLHELGISLQKVERGGDITYHGPGQIVAYPILDLRAGHLAVKSFVHGLEEVMIRTASDFGVTACRREDERGVWVGPRKLGSLGIAVSRGISYHGLAFNVDLDLEPFSWINPCGMTGVEMTSLCRETGLNPSPARVRARMKEHFQGVLGVRLS